VTAPFGLDPARQYDVGRDGRPTTDESEPVTWLGARHRLILLLFGLGLLVVGALAGMSVAALLSGSRGWAAIFALCALLAAPLLLLGPAQDWWRHRRGRRQAHAARPWSDTDDDGYG
jgi:MFS family permease